MESHTFRSRIETLVIKTRKALRLYTMGPVGIGRVSQNSDDSRFTEMQVKEWRAATTTLLQGLLECLKFTNNKTTSQEIQKLRATFQEAWRISESEMNVRHKDLVVASEAADFVKCARLGIGLVELKAKAQALEAAYQELDELVRKSRVSPAIELSTENLFQQQEALESLPVKEGATREGNTVRLAQVIPLRRTV